MSQPIVLYDLKREGTYEDDADMSFSRNTWKTRLARMPVDISSELNLFRSYALASKGIAFETKWVGFNTIDATMEALGVQPHPPGGFLGRKYTIPVIHDPNTQRLVMDSHKINRYLDEQYPQQPELFPPRTRVMQALVITNNNQAFGAAIFSSIIYFIFEMCSDEDKPWFRKSCEEILFGGKKLEEIAPSGESFMNKVKELEKILTDVGTLIDLNGPGSMFIGGDTPLHADCDIASQLMMLIKVAPEDHEMVKLVKTSGGGRWPKYLDAMSKARTDTI